jgi:hypothetical protein
VNLTEFRQRIGSYRLSVSEEAGSLKEPQLALIRLRDLYKTFDDSERAMADKVLAEWVRR